MDKSENDIRVLFFYNNNEKDLRLYKGIETHAKVLQNNMPHFCTLSLHECIQELDADVEVHFDNADIILLLLSGTFMASARYREEAEKVLQRHQKDIACVIPVLLSPVAWEDSRLGVLEPLPRNRHPISRWRSPEDAFKEVSEVLKDTIQRLLKKRGVEELDEGAATWDDVPISSTAFNWTDSISPFNYLTLSGKNQDGGTSLISRLRMIMQVFYEHQRTAVPDYLSEQEVYETVQQKGISEYRLQDCQKDLKYLASHFNLVRVDDMRSIAHSIPAFDALLHRKFYQATSDGFHIERFIEERMQSSKGRLSKSDLGVVRQHLIDINAYIEKPELKQNELDAMADIWHSAFDTWGNIVASSGDYFSTLERHAQYVQDDHEKYMQYKDTVFNYVQGFADTLMDISQEISALFSGWSQKKDLLIRGIAQSDYRRHPEPDPEKRPTLETTVEVTRKQITSLEAWFKEGVYVVYERAASEIQRVVSRAASMALFLRSHVNNVTALSNLAEQLLRITTFETAQQMFDVAFAHVLPLHLAESLAGYAQIHERAEESSSVWDEPPPARLSLASAKQGSSHASVRKAEDPLHEDMQKIYELQAEPLRKDADRQERFVRLFPHPVLHLDSHLSLDPRDRVILEEIIDACLNHPSNRYQDDKGNVIFLLNPHEQQYIHLRSHDGVLFLPCYQLKLQISSMNGDEVY